MRVIIATTICPRTHKHHEEFFSIKSLPNDLEQAEDYPYERYSPSQKLYIVQEGGRWVR